MSAADAMLETSRPHAATTKILACMFTSLDDFLNLVRSLPLNCRSRIRGPIQFHQVLGGRKFVPRSAFDLLDAECKLKLGYHLPLRSLRKAIASSSTRTASITGTTGRAWNSKAGSIEQNL